MSDIKTLTDRQLDAEIAKAVIGRILQEKITIDPISPPKYSTDLNAIHEAEKRLTKEQRCTYVNILSRNIVNTGVYWDEFHASARQKAEALLMTLRGDGE